MSLARRHQARILAAQTATLPAGGGTATAVPPAVAAPSAAPANRVAAPTRAAQTMAAQIAMRLTHDLRRLKAIKSIDMKIAAKREMLPAYASWVEGLLSGAQAAGAGASGDVLPTIMVWHIDVGDFASAMPLIEHVLAHKVPLPARYERDAATLVVEEIAEAAIKAQASDLPFDLEVLEQIDVLTAGYDMHDQVRAKLLKAIGVELDRTAQHPLHADAHVQALLARSIVALKEAQRLHDRVGVKTTIKAVEKRLAVHPPSPK